MAHRILRPDDPWRYTSGDRPDIRGWRVEDASGRPLGHVGSVVVDTEEDTIESIYLGPNTRFDAGAIRLGEGVVHLNVDVELPEPAPPAAADFDDFGDDFRRHFEATYAGSDRDFADYEHAYWFGRSMAHQGDLAGLPYERAHDDLHAIYELRHRGRRFEDVQEAVRHGYERGHALRPHVTASGSEPGQVIGSGDEGNVTPRKSAAHQTIAPPPGQERRAP